MYVHQVKKLLEAASITLLNKNYSNHNQEKIIFMEFIEIMKHN